VTSAHAASNDALVESTPMEVLVAEAVQGEGRTDAGGTLKREGAI
jgi:hypothetical protein